jgi:hypothetical protein
LPIKADRDQVIADADYRRYRTHQMRDLWYFVLRPSDERGPGHGGSGPPCAFKMPMINVFCNSHCFSQLAAFFIGARAERSTTENCLSIGFGV